MMSMAIGEVLQARLCPKWPINVGVDSTEGHGIKAMLSILMVAVLQRGISPDEVRFGVADSTNLTS